MPDYEIHLTTDPIEAAQWPAFRAAAEAAGMAALVVALARGTHPLQPMLTLHRHCGPDEIRPAAEAAARHPALAPYPIRRCKIEQDAAVDTGPFLYYEWHGRLAVVPQDEDRLTTLCQAQGGHLSRNVLRGGMMRYVTLREIESRAALERRVAALSASLAGTLDKQCWERVVFDSNLDLDAGWLEAPQ